MTQPSRREAAVARAQAIADQHGAELNKLKRWVRTHREFCEYPEPLCPGDLLWTYLEELSHQSLEQLFIIALYELVPRETVSEQT